MDPRIMKFLPFQHRMQTLRHRTEEGRFVDLPIRMDQVPNVVFYERIFDTLVPEKFLYEPALVLGDHNLDPDIRNTRVKSVLLLALRLAFFLGFRKVYMLGVDFEMNEEKPYAFDQSRTKQALLNNETMYKHLVKWFKLLRPRFEDAGFQVLNCNPTSKLDVFDHIPLPTALEETLTEGRMETRDWYTIAVNNVNEREK